MYKQIGELTNLGIQIKSGYLLGLQHGISLADLDHRFQAQIKEIKELRAALREKDGQESSPEAGA